MDLYKTKFSINPDREYEYFWLTLKTIMLKFSDKDLTEKIIILSEKLNKYQYDKDYDSILIHINLFLLDNIDLICKLIIYSKNRDIIYKFSCNLKKWFFVLNEHKINLTFNSYSKFLIDIIVLLLNKYIDDDNYNKYNIIIDIINDIINKKEYSFDRLFVYGIINNCIIISNFIKDYINLNKYILKDYNKFKYINNNKLRNIILDNDSEYFNFIKNML